MEITEKAGIFWKLISWQFFDVPKNILKAWKNYLKFYWNYFSILLLIKTFFSPWHRYKWSYGKGFDIGKYFEAFVSNLISRILGAILRFFLIIIGLLFEIFIIFAGISIFLGWLVLPILLILGLYYGVRIIF